MGPVIGLFVAIGAFIGAHAAVFILTAVSIGLNVVSGLLMKKPSLGNLTADMGNRTLNAKQAIAPRRVAYGLVQLGGVYTDIHTTGATNEYAHLVYTLTGHKIHAFKKVLFDGVEVPNALTGTPTGNFAGFAWFEFKLGASGEPAFPNYVAEDPSHWTSAHRQEGCASVHVKLKWDQDKFPNGVPEIRFEVETKEVYDPRSSTTGYSTNAALCVADYMMDAAVGLGIPLSEINSAALIAAANICDEDVALKAGGTQKRYDCNGSFELNTTPSDALRAMLSAMAGDVVYTGGQWYVHAGAYRAPTLTFSDDDLAGPIKVQVKAQRADICNAVQGVYVSPAHSWQPTSFPPVRSTAYRTEDNGEELWKDIQLPFTTDYIRAQRLAKITLETSRRQLTADVTWKLGAWQVIPGDGLYWTRPRFGWSPKEFRVRSLQLLTTSDNNSSANEASGPALIVQHGLQEWDANVYAWTAASDEQDDIVNGVGTLPQPSQCAAPTAVTLTSGAPTAIIRVDGVVISRLKVSWTAPNDAFVLNGGKIHVSYKKHADSVWIYEGPVDGSATEVYLSDVSDGVAYDVLLQAENSYGVRSALVTAGPHTIEGVGFAHASYRPTANPLRAQDAGGFPRVIVDDGSGGFTMRIAGVGDVYDLAANVDATSADFGKTAYLYYDDPAFAGGSVAYNLTFTREVALQGTARFFVGSIHLPDAGGPATVGNNDGGAGAQVAKSFTLLPGTVVADAGWTNTDNVLDDNVNTSTSGAASAATQVITLKGYPAYYQLFSEIVLKVRSQLTAITGTAPALIEYSLDGGATWQNLRTITAADASPVQSLLGVSTKQKTDLVQVRMTIPGGNGATPANSTAGTFADDSLVGAIAWTVGSPSSATKSSGLGTSATHYLKATNFGFAIPTGATIVGIQARINKRGTYSDDGAGTIYNEVDDQYVRIIKGGTVQTAQNRPAGVWPSVNGDSFHGGSSDLWGQTWTYTDINASNFGLAVTANLYRQIASTTAVVNSVQLTVYYTLGASTSSAELFHATQEVTF